MKRLSIFWQLFLAAGFIIVFSLALFGIVVASQSEKNEQKAIETELSVQCQLVREAVRGRNARDNAPLAERLRNLPLTDARLTLIDAKGQVLFETKADPAQMDNHAERAEIQQAKLKGTGKAIRRSPTLGQDMLYMALRTDLDDSDVAFIRIAEPIRQVESQLASLRNLSWTAAGLTTLVALGLAFWLSRRLARPIAELTQGAEAIATGAYGYRVYAQDRGEIGVLARTFNHMSERLAAQFAQIEEDRHQLRTVLSSMVEGVIAIDSEQRILFANDRVGRLLEMPVAQAIGKPFWELLRHRPLQTLVREALQDEAIQVRELHWATPGQRSFLVHVARLPGTPPRGAVLVLHDTTDLRRLERLRQEFVANVSHELKTPLAVIQASVETLIDGAAEDPTVRTPFLHRIADQSERLKNLIFDMLRLARVESETEAYSFETVDVALLVEDSMDRHRSLAVAKRQTFEAIPPGPDTPPLEAWADQEAMDQIVNNLVDNAVKYTPEGGTIRVRWHGEGEYAVIEVEDTGIGIPEKDLPRIFERFYRVDKARSRELGGTGLGLAIVKHLAQANHGSVTARSEVGKGSTFTVRLPTPTSPHRVVSQPSRE
ncbi:MAG: cell wall metabolism sensor histidine kinase WalK [Gemmataceae bacterium]|nr:cell wall metabolism sensor histidine kinase WalK [Gemmataceae bacterium]